MTHSWVWHDSLTCVTWLIDGYDRTHWVWVRHDSLMCVTWHCNTHTTKHAPRRSFCTPQHTAIRCNTMKHSATYCHGTHYQFSIKSPPILQHTATTCLNRWGFRQQIIHILLFFCNNQKKNQNLCPSAAECYVVKLCSNRKAEETWIYVVKQISDEISLANVDHSAETFDTWNKFTWRRIAKFDISNMQLANAQQLLAVLL